jgi:hypothetical protein
LSTSWWEGLGPVHKICSDYALINTADSRRFSKS